ncbi:hypothetical protein [Clostridium sp.]|uniref:hypothetical protein n=1 Tax=Clostridium sp. TaxID=1506 RepID=UPI001A4129FA|nr:hypothetical protein [Clostridium sp.]MBK5237342.1 hypothetical protein [Clostridium sp.]
MINTIMNVLRQAIDKNIFDMKYKLGIAKEGKDFFSCSEYDFCVECTPSDKPCKARFK